MLMSDKFKSSKHRMNIKTRILIIATCLITLSAPAPLFAANGARKGNKASAGGKADKAARPGVLLKKYDTDKNGSIDGTEGEALRKAFDAEKTGPLKKLDGNSDGTLDAKEIAGIKARHGKGKGKGEAAKGGKRKKKNV